MKTRKSDHWSDYWSRGCFTSLPQDFSANYDGEVAGFWREVFAAVPQAGRMLDLCTGNGAIALLAADFANSTGHQLDISAVDAATISPESLAGKYPDQAALLERINFISDCRVEELELEDASFDLLTSQFGVEYCDLEAAAAKVVRLLRPGGRYVMVTHTATSDILRFMQQESREYTFLEQQSLFESIRAYLAGETGFDEFYKGLHAAQAAIAPLYQQGGSPLFGSVLGTLTGILKLDEQQLAARRSDLEDYYGQIRHGFDRLSDMLRVNEAIQSDPRWFGVFEKAGLVLQDSGEIVYQGRHHAGGFLRFIKPADGES